MPANYYELLDVPPAASSSEINTAFKSKAKDVHPDQGGSTQRMKQLQKARETLTSQQSRDLYDSLGHYEYVQRYGGPVLDATPSQQQSTQTVRSSSRSSQSKTRKDNTRRRSQSSSSSTSASADPSSYTFVDHERENNLNESETATDSPRKSDQTETENMVASQIRGAAIGAIFLSLLFSVPSAWYIGSTFPLVLFLVGGEYIILIIGFALLYIISSLLYLKRRLRTFGYVS